MSLKNGATEDVKGFKTAKFKADVKRMKIYYPHIDIQEI